jgi:hypothetical protein
MVWGGISWEARTELVFIERGTLTAHRYTGCLKIASTKKKLWHLEALRNPRNQFLIF